MLETLATMRAAMRVLVAVTDGQTPNPTDVAKLRASVPGVEKGLPPDDLACQAIQQALKDRDRAKGHAA
jgi:hypothetical protein